MKENPLYKELKECLKNGHIPEDIPIRVKQLQGTFQNGESQYNIPQWAFLLNAPFPIGNRCCNVMKKNPSHKYAKQTGRKAFIAIMADESRQRASLWVKHGCNMFDIKLPQSAPMSFWTEQDVLLYIKQNNLPICSVYGDIVAEEKDQLAGQETWATLEIFDIGLPYLKTTGCNRTGCMFCGYGCHLEKEGDGRFERIKTTHPKQYEWIMKPWDEGGLGYKEVIDWLNEHGNLHIRY